MKREFFCIRLKSLCYSLLMQLLSERLPLPVRLPGLFLPAVGYRSKWRKVFYSYRTGKLSETGNIGTCQQGWYAEISGIGQYGELDGTG